jgi:hypothetical protein
MTFQDILAQVITWLQREQRVSYRALKRHICAGRRVPGGSQRRTHLHQEARHG